MTNLREIQNRIQTLERRVNAARPTQPIYVYGVRPDGTIDPSEVVMIDGRSGRTLTPDDREFPREDIDGVARKAREETQRAQWVPEACERH